MALDGRKGSIVTMVVSMGSVGGGDEGGGGGGAACSFAAGGLTSARLAKSCASASRQPGTFWIFLFISCYQEGRLPFTV